MGYNNRNTAGLPRSCRGAPRYLAKCKFCAGHCPRAYPGGLQIVMKLHHRILPLLLAVAMAFTVTACSPTEMLKDMIVNVVHAMGLGNPETDDEADELHAEQGGSITFPEGFPTEDSTNTMLSGGTFYVSFAKLRLYNTDYFTAASDSITVTAYGSTDETLTGISSYKVALWELNDDGVHATYVPGSTVYIDFSADETCYTHQITGLTAGHRYKATISFDSNVTYAAGAVSISGLTDDALVQAEGGDSAET